MNDQNSGGIVVQKKHIPIDVIMIIVLLIGGIVIGASWSRWFGVRQPDTVASDTADSARPPIELDENAGDYTGEKPADHGGEEVGIKIPGYPSITVARDTQDVTMALLNLEGKDTSVSFFASKILNTYCSNRCGLDIIDGNSDNSSIVTWYVTVLLYIWNLFLKMKSKISDSICSLSL